MAKEGSIRWGLAALTALSMTLAPAFAAQTNAVKAKKRPVGSITAGTFTPAVADPKLAAAFANRGVVGGSFRFTPSASRNRSKSVQVAVRARATTPADARRTAEPAPSSIALLTPTAYNLGVAIGWKRFALSGDISKINGGLMPLTRESAEVGLSYSASRRFTGSVKVGAERSDDDPVELIGGERAVSFDVGGSYSISSNIDLTGGLRYKIRRDRLQSLTDERRDSQAVYIGTAFRF